MRSSADFLYFFDLGDVITEDSTLPGYNEAIKKNKEG